MESLTDVKGKIHWLSNRGVESSGGSDVVAMDTDRVDQLEKMNFVREWTPIQAAYTMIYRLKSRPMWMAW
jgi:hypothetical protein